MSIGATIATFGLFPILISHFQHENILSFRDKDGNLIRPEFSNVKEMDECLIENWNSVVKPGDKIWHLGDVFFGNFDTYRDNIHCKLNGQKRLLLGNHDENNQIFKLFQKVQVIRRFDDFVCSHIPMHKFSCYNHRKEKTMVNVHGHTHNNDVGDFGYVNISCEKTGYKPIHYEDVLKLVRQNEVDELFNAIEDGSNG